MYNIIYTITPTHLLLSQNIVCRSSRCFLFTLLCSHAYYYHTRIVHIINQSFFIDLCGSACNVFLILSLPARSWPRVRSHERRHVVYEGDLALQRLLSPYLSPTAISAVSTALSNGITKGKKEHLFLIRIRLGFVTTSSRALPAAAPRARLSS